MTISVQSPAEGRQVSVWVPDPSAWATQKSCSPGGVDGSPAPVRMAGGEPEPRSVTMDRSTPPMYSVVSVTRAMPTKMSEPESAPVTWSFAVPSAEETGSQSAPVDRSMLALVMANPLVAKLSDDEYR